jgi:hypothetical protein
MNAVKGWRAFPIVQSRLLQAAGNDQLSDCGTGTPSSSEKTEMRCRSRLNGAEAMESQNSFCWSGGLSPRLR